MGQPPERDSVNRRRARQHEAVAALSETALETTDVGDLLGEAATTLVEQLDADRVAVLELQPNGGLLFRRGAGWPEHFRDRATVTPEGDSLLAIALEATGPIVADDLRGESAPSPSAVVARNDLDSGVAAAVRPGDHPWGLVAVYGAEREAFDDADAAFVERVTGVLSSAIENRERRRELERASRTLDDLLTHLPVSVYVKDEQHRHERVSLAMICGDDPDLYLENDEGKAHQHPHDLLGKTDYDIYGSEAAEPAVADDRQVMESGEPIVDKIERNDTRLGDEAFYSTTKAPRYDEDGDPAGIVGITLDVTDRIRYRHDLEQQNERLEEFGSMLAHDLRNPLTVAQGFLEVLEEDGADETAIEGSREALNRIEELTEEILTYARQGKAVVDPDVVDLESVARDAWGAVDTPAATLSVDADLPVRADASRLQRVLENLFRNAVEHGGDDVAVRVADDGTDFYVEDDGPGVPEDRREDLFERGVTTNEDGTGFGLATVQTIAEAHGWSVDVEDGTEGGARFAFSGVVRSDAD